MSGRSSISLTKVSMKALRSVSSLFLQEPAHVLGVGRDGLHVIEDRPALGQDCPRPLSGGLKALLTLLVVSDAMGEVGTC